MVERFFEFLLTFDQLQGMALEVFRAGLDPIEIGLGHDTFLDERLAGEQFDLEPEFELVFVGPDFPHPRARIPLNHGREGMASRDQSRGSSVG